MPRYYFHVRDRETVILPDSEGIELAGPDLPPGECRKIIESVLSEEGWRDQLSEDRELQVVDDSDRTPRDTPLRSAPEPAEDIQETHRSSNCR